jgi:hypothetical protein
MKIILILGLALIIMGAAFPAHDNYGYTMKETMLQFGLVNASGERAHAVSLPPITGWLPIGGGVFLPIFSAWSEKD